MAYFDMSSFPDMYMFSLCLQGGPGGRPGFGRGSGGYGAPTSSNFPS